MYLTSHYMHYGLGRIEIDGETVGTPSGYRAKQGALFLNADYPFPARCAGGPCPCTEHVARVTVLPKTDEPRAAGGKYEYGFGINSIMCIHLPATPGAPPPPKCGAAPEPQTSSGRKAGSKRTIKQRARDALVRARGRWG
jgi:hypothetical protein